MDDTVERRATHNNEGHPDLQWPPYDHPLSQQQIESVGGVFRDGG